MKITDVLSTKPPETEQIGRARRIGAVIVASAVVLGFGVGAREVAREVIGADGVGQSDVPTHVVEVEAGDTGVVWREASKVAAANGVDPRDVVDQIYANSPDLDDGIAHPDDVLRVPMTEDQIAQAEQQPQENLG